MKVTCLRGVTLRDWDGFNGLPLNKRAVTHADSECSVLRKCMTWVGRQRLRYGAFVSSVVLTSGPVMGGADGRPWEFPTSERWSLVTSRFGGAPKALRALLSSSPAGVEVCREIRLLCAPAIHAQGRWQARP